MTKQHSLGGIQTHGKGLDKLRKLTHRRQSTPDSFTEQITKVPLRTLALAHYVHKHQRESASFTILTEPEIENDLGETFAPTFIITFRNAKPHRQYKAVVVKDWGRPVSVDRVQMLKEQIQRFDILQGGELVGKRFSSQARWLAEEEGVPLLHRGRLHSEAYKHYGSVEEIERLANSEDIIKFEEVFST